MKINKVGINYTHNNKFIIDRPNGSGDYLFIQAKTPAVFILDGKKEYAEKDSIIIYKKGTPQKYFAQDNNYVNDFIHFDIDNEREIRNLPLDTLFKPPVIKPVNKLIKEIYLEYISKNVYRNESMNLLLKMLFVKVRELVIFEPHDNILYDHQDELLELRSKIYRHPEERWTVEKLSQKVNLSPSYFQRLYKQMFGITCISDVITSKIEYAKHYLSSTGCTVREISMMCGYDNYEHFMRQFKQLVGLTPTQYRKQKKG